MIRFACEHCGRKIRVADAAAGRKGHCPHCKQVLIIPELALQDLAEELSPKHDEFDRPASNSARAMICYECQMCSKSLSTPKAEQGEIKECPHCGSFVEVPSLQKKAAPDIDDKVQFQPGPPAQDDYEDPFESSPRKILDVAPKTPKRILPVFLDVFLYPFSKAGLFLLLAFTLAPLLLYPVAFLGCFGGVIYLALMLCVTAYMFWYFSLCIQKSAGGEVRAPDTFNEDRNIEMMDMVLQMLRTLLLIVVCLLPPFIYTVITKSAGIPFFAILTGCVFFLPMMLLASVMFDSFWVAWNLRVIMGGIFSSFFGYLVLVVAFYIPIGIYFYVKQVGFQQGSMVLKLVLNACSIYLIMISSHLLGWFFYKNEEKLYWSV